MHVPKGVSCFKGIIMMMSVVQNVEVFNRRCYKQGVAYESLLPFSYKP